MSRSWINFLLDVLLLLHFLVLLACSAIIRFVFPPPFDAPGWRLWGGGYDQWLTVQFGLVAALALLILLHVMLHWNWVCGLLAQRLARHKKNRLDDGSRTLYGVGLLVVVLGSVALGLLAAALTIQRPGA